MIPPSSTQAPADQPAAASPRRARGDPDFDAPSVRAVLAALQADEHAMTSADLRAASGLPRRTVYSALRVLRLRGLLRERASLRDTRQTFFWLARGPLPGVESAERLPGSRSQPGLSAANAGPA